MKTRYEKYIETASRPMHTKAKGTETKPKTVNNNIQFQFT